MNIAWRDYAFLHKHMTILPSCNAWARPLRLPSKNEQNHFDAERIFNVLITTPFRTVTRYLSPMDHFITNFAIKVFFIKYRLCLLSAQWSREYEAITVVPKNKRRRYNTTHCKIKMAVLIEYRTCASYNVYEEKERTTYRQLTRWPVVLPKTMFTNCFICFLTLPRYCCNSLPHYCSLYPLLE